MRGIGINIGFGGSGGGVPEFTPASISGLSLWHDAADAATITQSGGQVIDWADKSGFSGGSGQGTGLLQPITNSRTINGKNAIDFNGTTQWLEMSTAIRNILSTSNFDIFIAAASDSISTFQHILGGRDSTLGDVRFGVMAGFSASVSQAMCNPSYTTSDKSVTKDTNAHVFGCTRTGATIQSIFDGGALGPSVAAANTTMNSLRIGQTAINTAYFNGLIGEILIYGTNLTTANRNLVGNYLNSKWGTPWTNL